MKCETTDFIYPLLVDVYYPIVEQGSLGNVKKQWILDKTLACSFGPQTTRGKEEITPNQNITISNVLVGRTKSDLRISSLDSSNSVTNVILTNIRDKNGIPLYMETAGVRSGKSSIFEIAAIEPMIGLFGKVDYYKVVIRRSENQGADI